MHLAPLPFTAPGGAPPLTWAVGRLQADPRPASGWELDVVPIPDSLVAAVPRRRATFAAGRLALRAALEAAGHPVPAPWAPRLPSGAPELPAGWIGSLGHSDSFCVAAVGHQHAVALLGVDCEALMSPSTANEVVRLAAPELLSGPAHPALSFPEQVTLAFSAKESLYKALHPAVGRFFGLEAARCDAIDVVEHTIALVLTESLTPEWPAGMTWRAHWTIVAEHAVTWVAEASPPGPSR